MGQKDHAIMREQLDQVEQGAAAITRGESATAVTIIVERTRFAEPRLVTPAEADILFQPRVIEIDTGR